MKEEGDTVVFTKDHLSTSPGMVAAAVVGRTVNGWLDWKTKDGKSLDAVKWQTSPRLIPVRPILPF